MRRGDFENLARMALDAQLNSRGFRLVPLPPADFSDDNPMALYEADPNDFGPQYPALDPRIKGITPCVDLWIHLDTSTGKVTSDLDGTPLDSLANQFGVSRVKPTDVPAEIDYQLSRLASEIVAVLDAAKTQ